MCSGECCDSSRAAHTSKGKWRCAWAMHRTEVAAAWGGVFTVLFLTRAHMYSHMECTRCSHSRPFSCGVHAAAVAAGPTCSTPHRHMQVRDSSARVLHCCAYPLPARRYSMGVTSLEWWLHDPAGSCGGCTCGDVGVGFTAVWKRPQSTLPATLLC
jgi:hypothetical protein